MSTPALNAPLSFQSWETLAAFCHYNHQYPTLAQTFASENVAHYFTFDARVNRNYGLQPSAGLRVKNDRLLLAAVKGVPRDIIGRRYYYGSVPLNMVEPLQFRQLENGEVTQLPQSVIDRLGPPIDLGILNNGCLTGTLRVSHLATSRQTDKRKSIEETVTETALGFDQYHSLSMISPSDEMGVAIVNTLTAHDGNIKCIKLSNLYKAGSEPAMEFVQQTPAQVASGARLFLAKSKIFYAHQQDLVWRQCDFVHLVLLESSEKLFKFAKSRDFILTLVKELAGPSGAEPKPKQSYADARDIVTYWPGLFDIIKDQKRSILPKKRTVENVIGNAPVIDNQLYHLIGIESAIASSDVGRSYQRFTQNLEKFRQEEEEIKVTIKQQKRAIEGKQRDITYYENALKYLTTEVAHYTADLAALEPTLEAKREVLKELEKQSKQKEAEYQAGVIALKNSGTLTQVDWFNNLKNSGIIVIDAEVRHNTSGITESLKEHPERILDKNWRLTSVHFVTTKPNLIYINKSTSGAKAKTVVGGPYEVRVSCPNANTAPTMSVRLATTDAVFGINKSGGGYQIAIHPHCAMRNITQFNQRELEGILNEWHNPCMGDARTPLTAGFNQKDIRVVVTVCYSWLQSCNSNDGWGAHYPWFPKAGEVDIEGKYIDKLENNIALDTTQLYDLATKIQQNILGIGVPAVEPTAAPAAPVRRQRRRRTPVVEAVETTPPLEAETTTATPEIIQETIVDTNDQPVLLTNDTVEMNDVAATPEPVMWPDEPITWQYGPVAPTATETIRILQDLATFRTTPRVTNPPEEVPVAEPPVQPTATGTYRPYPRTQRNGE